MLCRTSSKTLTAVITLSELIPEFGIIGFYSFPDFAVALSGISKFNGLVPCCIGEKERNLCCLQRRHFAGMAGQAPTSLSGSGTFCEVGRACSGAFRKPQFIFCARATDSIVRQSHGPRQVRVSLANRSVSERGRFPGSWLSSFRRVQADRGKVAVAALATTNRRGPKRRCDDPHHCHRGDVVQGLLHRGP